MFCNYMDFSSFSPNSLYNRTSRDCLHGNYSQRRFTRKLLDFFLSSPLQQPANSLFRHRMRSANRACSALLLGRDGHPPINPPTHSKDHIVIRESTTTSPPWLFSAPQNGHHQQQQHAVSDEAPVWAGRAHPRSHHGLPVAESQLAICLPSTHCIKAHYTTPRDIPYAFIRTPRRRPATHTEQESLALASMARDDPPASSTASSTAPAMRGKVESEFEN